MSYDFHAPWSGERRPPRWPWAATTILLASIIGVTVLLTNDGYLPGQNGQLLSANATHDVARANSTDTPAPTFTPVPTPTSVSLEAPTTVAKDFLTLWNESDYAGMYALLSPEAQATIRQEDFVNRYVGIEQKAGITAVDAQVSGTADSNGMVPFDVAFQSTLVGELKESNQLQMVQVRGQWLVKWEPQAILKDLANNGCVDFIGDTMTRGSIFDRNGVVLAEDAPMARISIVPASVGDMDATVSAVAEISGMSVSDVQTKVDNAPNPEWPVAIADLPIARSTELLNAVQPYSGVTVTQTTQRQYPQGKLTTHLVGWVSRATQEDIESDSTGTIMPDQMIGRTGIELGADEVLRGTPGGQLLVVECNTRETRKVIAETQGTPPKDIYLTIDINFQRQVDAALTTAEHTDPANPASGLQGRRSAAVVMDPRTGEIMAMVSHPTFDPNGFITGNFSDADRTLLTDDTLGAQINRATGQALPTGSIFKVITTAAAMHDLGWTADTPVNCPASIEIGGQTWNDWVVENGLLGQGMLTLHQGLVNSCNTVFYQIADQLDQQDENALPSMALAFGLGERTGIPYLTPDSAGSIPSPDWKLATLDDYWARGDAVNMSIGQGYVTATPLQMTRVYAAIANGGDVLQPYVVGQTQVRGEDKVQVGERKVVGQLPLTADQIVQIQAMLRDQTSSAQGFGSCKVFCDFPWSISGKTGTAQIDEAQSSRPHSWFAAYGPYPADGSPATISSIVMVENVGEGVSYAAPVTKKIYEYYVNYGTGPGPAEPTPTPAAGAPPPP